MRAFACEHHYLRVIILEQRPYRQISIALLTIGVAALGKVRPILEHILSQSLVGGVVTWAKILEHKVDILSVRRAMAITSISLWIHGILVKIVHINRLLASLVL